MPEPTYGLETGGGITVNRYGNINSKDPTFLTKWGYQAAEVVKIVGTNIEIHDIVSTGTLTTAQLDSTTYNLAPLGSLLRHITASNVKLFYKAVASGAAAWVKVTTGAHGI